MQIPEPIHAPASHMILALLLGLAAAAANILGGMFVLYRKWSRQYLKYFLALGAGFTYSAMRVWSERTPVRARQVLLASTVYLPFLYGLLALDRSHF